MSEESRAKLICERCVRAIQSRGESIKVGGTSRNDDAELICDWCGENVDTLYETYLGKD